MTAVAPTVAPESLRVLVFEDNAMDVALIRKFLQTAGVAAAHIFQADTIRTAMQVLARERVDLCLADYYLRPHTGFDLMDEARRSDLSIPFIMLTALDDRTVDEGALARGAYAFLVKGDLTVEALERSMRYALTHHRKEKHLAREAMFDSMTGLPNRKAFLDRLTRAVADGSVRSGMVAVTLMNINGMKFFNEAFGQRTGDELLAGVAQKLKAAKRPSDVIGRFSGDEFAILTTDVLLPKDAIAVARHYMEAVTGPVESSDGGHDITVGVGVAALNSAQNKSAPATFAERLMQQANQAMLNAKQSGRMTAASELAVARMH